MAFQYGCTAGTTGKQTRSSPALTLAVGLALALSGSAAMAIGEPIPGIDIVVKKNPGGIPVTVPSDPSGRFSLRLAERGQYTISTSCRLPGGCLPHALSRAPSQPGADPSAIAILIGLLLPAQQAGATTYDFMVGERGAVLSGQIPSAGGVRVATADVNGDGVETRTFKIAENESPRPVDRLSAAPPRHGAGPSISDQAAAGGLTSYGTAPPPKGDGEKLPGKAGQAVPGTEVWLDIDRVRVGTAKTDENGAYKFTKLPSGKYTLSIAGQPPKAVTVGTGGEVNGKVVRGSDGKPVILIPGTIGFGTAWTTPGGFGPTGLGNGNAMAPGIPAGMGAASPGGFGAAIPGGFGAGSPGGFGAGSAGGLGAGSPAGVGAGSPGGAMGGGMNSARP